MHYWLPRPVPEHPERLSLALRALPSGLKPQPRPLLAPPGSESTSAWAAQYLNFHPDPVQAAILDSPDPYLLLCCTRQFGKSTLTALKAVHHALTTPFAQIIVAAPGERQSNEFLGKAAAALNHLQVPRRPAGLGVTGFLLPNGSRLIALPAAPRTTRGFSSVSLLIFEEAAFVPDDLYHALTPTQAAVAHPRLWLISTPDNQSGFFHDEWAANDRPHWRRFKVTADQCPRISPEFLELERIRKGEAVFRREYMCEFTAFGAQVISHELLDAAASDLFDSWNNGKPLWPR